MTPAELYQARSQQQSLSKDPQQERVLKYLDRLAQALVPETAAERGFLGKLFGSKTSSAGLYLWGGVGAGKTMLMDIFYETLPFPEKKRTHFHHFMQTVHFQLKQQKRSDPLQQVAQYLASQCRVLCLDEFIVTDITDAMILSGLLKNLFAAGVCLVTTSNTEPAELYKNGLQRARFLPAIELIKRHLQIVHLDSRIDYRLRTLQREGTYHYPLNDQTRSRMESTFTHLSSGGAGPGEIEICQRPVAFKGMVKGVIWFDFQVLCRSARSQNDYIEIASRFHSLLLSGVKVMDPTSDDTARRFLNLIDVLYAHKVKLVVSADAPPDELYRGKRLTAEFKRATSRLFEMQSEEYLAKPHSS
ncbi:MAG TPA: cell division protein ZapE [Gammaproteobacteria bacterium]|nr:cell division protein ZapE [Gammaproteobacteria bacterium]